VEATHQTLPEINLTEKVVHLHQREGENVVIEGAARTPIAEIEEERMEYYPTGQRGKEGDSSLREFRIKEIATVVKSSPTGWRTGGEAEKMGKGSSTTRRGQSVRSRRRVGESRDRCSRALTGVEKGVRRERKNEAAFQGKSL